MAEAREADCQLTRSITADLTAELGHLERSAAAGTKAAGRGLRTELRRQVTATGLGQRLARTWREKHYDNRGLDAASLIYTKAPQIIRAFEGAAPVRQARSIPMPGGCPRPVMKRLTDAFVELVDFDFVDQYRRHLPPV